MFARSHSSIAHLRPQRPVVFAFGLSVLLLAGCGGNGGSKSPTSTTQPTGTTGIERTTAH